jgi:tripartite-type tricarboxylate transporter receptor subunit TctC
MTRVLWGLAAAMLALASAAPAVVSPSVPATSVSELLAYLKANAGKVNFASAGNGTSSHLAGELFKSITGVNVVHVPYRGGALANDRSDRRPGPDDD